MTRMLSTLNLALAGLVGSLSLPAWAANDAPASTGDAASTAPAPSEDHGPPLLFGQGVDVGGYGGLDVAYTRMFGRDGVVVGGQGAVLINHRLALGIAGYGWSNPLEGPNASNGDAQRFETGYGGFTAHYSFYLDQLPVYLTVGALVGAGAIDLTDQKHSDGFDGFDDKAGEDVFGIVQPDLAIHANLTRWMRVGLTASYRLTSGVNRLGFKESDVNGAMVGTQIQFGSF
jgi:hypothetical protein